MCDLVDGMGQATSHMDIGTAYVLVYDILHVVYSVIENGEFNAPKAWPKQFSSVPV